MGFKLRSGNGPLPFKQMGSSPAKQGIFGGITDLVQEKGDPAIIDETKDPGKIAKIGPKQKPGIKVNAFGDVLTEHIKNTKEKGDMTKPEKEGWLKKTGKVIKKGVKKGVKAARKATMTTKEDIAQRKEEKKHTLKEQIRAEKNPEKRLELRKKSRNKIADSLEYLFLDGERPDVKQAKKEAAEAKEARADARFEKLYGNDQNKHTGYIDPDNAGNTENVNTTWEDIQKKYGGQKDEEKV